MGNGDNRPPDVTGGDVGNNDLSVGENVRNKLPPGIIALDCTIVGRSNVGNTHGTISVVNNGCANWASICLKVMKNKQVRRSRILN